MPIWLYFFASLATSDQSSGFKSVTDGTPSFSSAGNVLFAEKAKNEEATEGAEGRIANPIYVAGFGGFQQNLSSLNML